MTLPAFATLDDLVARTPGGISGADETRAQAALDDASSLIRDEAGKTWATLDDLDDAVADTLLRVCCSAARRTLDNPEGASEEHLGPYGQQLANASSDVYLTSAEKRAVRRAAGKGGIGAVPITRGPLETQRCAGVGDTQYLDVDPAGEPFPWLADEVGY